MPEKQPPSKKSITPDWLVRGVLTKIGDIFDRLTGRGWKPSSSLATSELIERLKALLDAEAENTDGRGYFIPHNIQLKMQWDKFSTDSDESLRKLENEMLTAVIDHINDKRYYTYQPLSIEVRPDYFTQGVKLFVSFDKILDEDEADAVHVIVPGAAEKAGEDVGSMLAAEKYVLRFTEKGKPKVLSVEFAQDKRKGIGRTKENDIAIDDASVSKIHASLVLNAEGRLVLADTGSTNGTFINGRRIAYGKAEPLNEGDKVNFGTVEVTFQHVPKQIPDKTANPTQADTVSINGLEFTSKRTETPTEAFSSDAALEKTIDPIEFAKRSDEAPMQKTIASNDVVLKAIETPISEKELTFSDLAAKPTENRIDFDFSEHEKEPGK